MYVMLVTLVALVHFTFCLYVVFGGFLAIRWPWTIVLHVSAVAWGIGSVLLHFSCPLTWLERIARDRAGMSPLPSEGFIAHYVTGVLYPSGWDTVADAVVFSLVAVSWFLYLRVRSTQHRAVGTR